MIKPLWTEIHKAAENILNIAPLLHFSTLFFGNVDFQARRPDEYLLGILIIAGKKALTRYLCFLNPPQYNKWMDVNYIYVVERINFPLRL